MIFKKTQNKIKKFVCAMILSVTMSGMALAAVEWNTAVTSEYIWRGMSKVRVLLFQVVSIFLVNLVFLLAFGFPM